MLSRLGKGSLEIRFLYIGQQPMWLEKVAGACFQASFSYALRGLRAGTSSWPRKIEHVRY